jgi:hypothetical protein
LYQQVSFNYCKQAGPNYPLFEVIPYNNQPLLTWGGTLGSYAGVLNLNNPFSGYPITFSVGTSEKMRLDSSGELLIGATTQGRETNLAVVGTYQDPVGAWAQVGIYSNDSYAINKGGTLMFGGQDGLNVRSYFAAIKGAKSTATSSDYSGYLAFYTRPVGDVPAERMRITSGGDVLVGTTSNAGVTTNTAQVVGGVFSTATGTVTAAHSTATTIFTATSVTIGCYIVTIGLAGSGTVYNTVGLVVTDASASKVTILSQGALSNITSSGLTVQATQTSGISQTIYWTATRIS